MEAFGIYLLQVWILTGIVILLHSYRHKFGLMPFFFMVATLMVLLNFSTFINVRFQITPDIRLGIAGHVFTPVILISLIILYVADGERLAQFELAGLVGVNTLTILLLSFVVAYLSLNLKTIIPPSSDLAIDFIFLRRRFASAVSFTGSMIVVAIVYQFFRNLWHRFPEGLAIALALLVALWTDSFIFLSISDLGLGSFFADFQNDLLGKTVATLAVGLPLIWYLTQIVEKSSDYREVAGRPIFAILFGSLGRLNAMLKRLESELRVSRHIYEELTEQIGEIFWLADAKTENIIYISPAFERITGFKRTDYYQHFSKIEVIVHPDDLHSQDLTYWLQPKANEFRIIRPDGEIRWMRNRTFSINDENGKIYRYAGIIEDFTEQKTARERDFELAVAQERMTILHNFIRDASHDLKSPLNAILLKLDMLERYSHDEDRRQKINEELKERVKYLSTLIDELFVLSRIEGHDEVSQNQLIFDDVVKEVANRFLPLAQEKAIDLIWELQTENASITANPEQLERVVGNLVSNAIRYTDSGTIRVATSIESEYLKLEIKDTGMGISEEDLPNIFNRFYRGNNTKTLSGTGLGLAISKAIVDNHGGEIKIASELNEGTAVTVLLPIASRL